MRLRLSYPRATPSGMALFFYRDFVSGGCRGRVETTQKGAKHGNQKYQSRHRQSRRFQGYAQPRRLARARACAHAREENSKPHSEAALAQWRTTTFGGDFDPVRAAVDEAESSFSSRQPEDDRRIWLKIANEIGYEAFRDLYLEQCANASCATRPPRSRTASTVTPGTTPAPQLNGNLRRAPLPQSRVRGKAPPFGAKKEVHDEQSDVPGKARSGRSCPNG